MVSTTRIKSPTRKDVQDFAELVGFPPGSHVFKIAITPEKVSVSCREYDDERRYIGDVTYEALVVGHPGGDA